MSFREKFNRNKILRIVGVAVLVIVLSYLIYIVTQMVVPMIITYLETLGGVERLVIQAIGIVVIGALVGFTTFFLYIFLYKSVYMRWKHDLSVRDQNRKLLLTSAGTISNLVLNMKKRDKYVNLPKALKDTFESGCIVLAFNPDEGGVLKFGGRAGKVYRSFIGKAAAYIIKVGYSQQDVEIALIQRNAELPIVNRIVDEINNKHGQFSATLSIIGYGITSMTCDRVFPKPSSDILIKMLIADRETNIDRGYMEGVRLEKAKMLKDIIIDTVRNNRILILIENMMSYEEMNKILQGVITVIGIALTRSDQSDRSHLLNLRNKIVTLTNVIEYNTHSARQFGEKIRGIKEGIYQSGNDLLILYPIRQGQRNFESNYVLFAVGKAEDVDSVVSMIQNVLGQAAAVIRADLNVNQGAWVVLMVPLEPSDLLSYFRYFLSLY